jgi:ABC-type amino acid transport substrate-binding protein
MSRTMHEFIVLVALYLGTVAAFQVPTATLPRSNIQRARSTQLNAGEADAVIASTAAATEFAPDFSQAAPQLVVVAVTGLLAYVWWFQVIPGGELMPTSSTMLPWILY